MSAARVKKLKGVGVALITPFDANLNVDYKSLEVLVKDVSKHVDFLVVNGTSSEASTLSLEEKNNILASVKKINNGKLPIVYGIGANDTQYVLDLIDKTDFNGVDAVLTVSPYYNKPSQRGIYAHYIAVADKSPAPIILYNVPGRTGSMVEASTTIKLSSHPNIVGIKEASADFDTFMKIQKHTPEDFLLISGDDMLTMPMITLGGVGVISVLANAYPEKFTKAIHSALQYDFKGAQNILNEFVDLNPLLYEESNPVGIKQVLAHLGKMDDQVRLPLLVGSLELSEKIRLAMPAL